MALYRNLVTDLLRYEKIITTEAKAKETRAMAEKVITMGKEGTLHARRRALAFVMDKKVVEKVFDELAKRYAERPGGYTRILKLGPRLGDAAPVARLELV
jgi:large subunit ribosomal protein L17